ncbi:MAG TPA: EAL domain-containing protein [Pseudolabrys sp.]|nr:EAL domain-containing protein [Pseudolabrys sp.]
MFVRAFTRWNLIAIAVGALLAGVPSIAFDFWLGGMVDRQGRVEVESAAHRAIALVDFRLGQAAAALDRLAAEDPKASSLGACGPDAVAAMRRADFLAPPIKEITFVSPDGVTLCSDRSIPADDRKIVSSETLPLAGGLTLDLIQFADAGSMVRLRRMAGAGPNQMAALVPTSLLLPQATIQDSPFSAYARVSTGSGFFVGDVGRPPAVGEDQLSATASSDRFGLQATIRVPRAMLPAERIGFRWIGLVVTAAILLIVGIFAWLMPRRRLPHDPIAEMERALKDGEFVPYYQPVVDIRSGQLRGAEVLVRWRKSDGTLVLPGTFIPLAESSGLIRAMTRDLMRRVCVEAGPAIGRRPALKISFNFAGQLFSDENIVNEVRNIFARSPIKLSQVVLELTERDPVENFTETRRTIAALQGLGVCIAIDDVGTGHSGLSCMLKLGADIIKIDKMFVDAIGTDRNSTTIVETLVDLAHNLRMDVVAEGVENFEQVTHLRELGVRSAQGYVFAPPLPGSSFLKLIEAIDPLAVAADEAAERPAA